jgi:hypothetical protein
VHAGNNKNISDIVVSTKIKGAHFLSIKFGLNNVIVKVTGL